MAVTESATVSINFTTNNITYKDGDSLIISFDGKFGAVKEFTGYTETTSPVQTSNDYYMTNLRWSLDDATWSPWLQLAVDPNTGDKSLPDMSFAEGSDINLQFKYIRVSQPQAPTGQNTLSVTNVTLKLDTTVAESDYKAPPAKMCPTGDFYKGIKVDCDGGLFRVYDLMAPAIDLNRSLSLAVSEMFGHQVCYFKTTADQKSKDFILKEYSLYNVTDVKNVRIVVPDNAFPDNAIMYTPFDMDFESPFEVQIVKEDFEKAFGYCVRPEERDYLYFPLENRLYEIQSAYLFKDFMRDGTYYKVALWKWQDKDNVMRTAGSTAQTLTDSLTENFDDLFKTEDEKEFTQITKPLQYETLNIGDWDFIRSLINANLQINKHDINNYFTIVAKYAYDLNTIDYDTLGIRYKTKVNLPEDEDRVYLFWFQANRKTFVNTQFTASIENPEVVLDPGLNYNLYPIGSSSYGMGYDTLFDGFVPSPVGATSPSAKGIQLNLQYGPDTKPGSTAYITTGFEVKVNNDNYIFNETYLEPWPDNGFPNLLVDAKQYNQNTLQTERKWFACVLNVSNQYGTMNLNIWEMSWDATKPAYTQQSTELKLRFGQTKTFTKTTLALSNYYELKGFPGLMTNIRILKELINEENQPLMLNRYTVRDNQYAEMIDNALPPLKMTRGSSR